jgi:hypothetical protein
VQQIDDLSRVLADIEIVNTVESGKWSKRHNWHERP